MEAANKGATDGGGQSVGLNIQLPFEQRINPYVKQSTAFYYFFTRKVMLTSPAQAFVFFPGGFGTMDEFFEVIDMIELKKIPASPVILVGKEYWQPLIDFINDKAVKIGSVAKEETSLWHLVDSAEEAYKIISKQDKRGELCELSPTNFRCDENLDWKIFRIMAELVEGFEFLTGVIENATILGTKHIDYNGSYFKNAYKLAQDLSNEGFSIVTGGGSGIAEAANKGAMEAGGESLGINMEVGGKAKLNSYVTRSIVFKFPFTRKLIVTAPSKGFIFFPGGFGTMHHFFEILTLMQTKKMSKIPILLFDHDFWSPLHSFIKKVFVHGFETIADEDDELYQIIDDTDTALKLIKDFRNKV